VSEETKNKVAFCPHCGNVAPQRLVFAHRFEDKGYAMADTAPRDQTFPTVAYLTICETCDNVLLYGVTWNIPEDDDFTKSFLLYPAGPQLHHSVPSRVQEIYAEALRIQRIAPNAFAVQIRRALEAVCEDRKAPTGTLYKRLQHLASRGDIPPTLAEMTDLLRLLGNVGAHAGSTNIQPGYVFPLDEFFRAIVEYVYVAPSKIRDFQEHLSKVAKGSSSDANV
jgi:hypothetical protein